MSYSSELYIHDLDRKATDALNKFPRFIKLVETYNANYDEKTDKFTFLSSAIRLSEKQMPEIYNQLPPICDKLGIPVPELYFVKSKEINAATGGSTKPFIYVTSKLVKKLPPDLISSVLAHECGHIACQHNLYHSIAAHFVNGFEKSFLAQMPVIRGILTPSLVRALLFWDRCSELSADRAAVLCDGNAEKTVDALLKVHGYDENINLTEFLNQAMDLKDFTNDSVSNKFLEQMLMQDETHPRMAMRAYECYEWAKSEQYQGIIAGTYTVSKREKEEKQFSEEEIIAAELHIDSEKKQVEDDVSKINRKLKKVDSELNQYMNKADRTDYAVALGSGILAGILDCLFVGRFRLEEVDQWGNERVGDFVVHVAKMQGYMGNASSGAIKYLEDKFPIAADKVTTQFGGGRQHHLQDFTHHPTPIGLACSILTQFTGKIYGTDNDGAFQVVRLNAEGLSLIGKNIPEKIMLGVVNWIFHIVSDMAGSSGAVRSSEYDPEKI